jgi:hypothetical protein
MINHLADLLDGIPDPFFTSNFDRESKIEDLFQMRKQMRQQTIEFELSPFQEDELKILS